MMTCNLTWDKEVSVGEVTGSVENVALRYPHGVTYIR